jgi:hypothetical protein
LDLMLNRRELAIAFALIGSATPVAALLAGVAHSLAVLTAGRIEGGDLRIIRDNWVLVVVSILVFLAFFALIPVRLKKDWRSHGVYVAFIISIFAEMFGFPLSVYFWSSACR